MKRIDIIFSEVTILNFNFIYKMFLKYKYVTFLMPLLVGVSSYYIYQTQHDISVSSISFTTVSENNVSATDAVAELMGEKTHQLSESEVLGMVKSVNFTELLAQKLINDPNFSKLDLSPITFRKRTAVGDKIEKCKSETNPKSCINSFVRLALGSLYSVRMDKMIDNKYILKINTLDKLTTRRLLYHLKQTTIEYRESMIKRSLSEQIKITEKIIKEEKAKFNEDEYANLTKQNQLVEGKITHIDLQLELISRKMSDLQLALSHGSISVKESIKSQANESEIRTKRELIGLIAQRDKLLEDISAVEVSLGSSVSSNNISTNLKNSLKMIQSRIKNYKKRTLASSGIEETNLGGVQFAVSVKKREVAALQMEMNKFIDIKEKLAVEKRDIEVQLEKIKPNLDFIKLIYQKLTQLKVLSLTAVSDLIFDKYSSGFGVYKRKNLLTIILSCGALSFFFMIGFVLIRFVFDDRIFDEEELKSNFKDLDIIGEVPKFN